MCLIKCSSSQHSTYNKMFNLHNANSQDQKSTQPNDKHANEQTNTAKTRRHLIELIT